VGHYETITLFSLKATSLTQKLSSISTETFVHSPNHHRPLQTGLFHSLFSLQIIPTHSLLSLFSIHHHRIQQPPPSSLQNLPPPTHFLSHLFSLTHHRHALYLTHPPQSNILNRSYSSIDVGTRRTLQTVD
jgi:hypothetical protein